MLLVVVGKRRQSQRAQRSQAVASELRTTDENCLLGGASFWAKAQLQTLGAQPNYKHNENCPGGGDIWLG